MAEIVLPPALSPSTAASSTASTATSISARPAQGQPVPSGLATQAIGSQIPATVQSISQAPSGQPVLVLQTSMGNLSLTLPTLGTLLPQLAPQLPPQGGNLLLQVTGLGSQQSFLLLGTDGRPLNTTTSQPGQVATSAGGPTVIKGATPLNSLNPGSVTTATFLRPITAQTVMAGASSQNPLTAALTQGTAAAGKAIQQFLPTNPATPATASTPGSPHAGGPQAVGSTMGTDQGTGQTSQGTAQTAILPSGTKVVVRTVSLTPPIPGIAAASPSASQGPSPTLTQGMTLQGVVTGAQAVGQTGGQTIVDTALGPLSLPVKNPPATGSRITLVVTSLPSPGSQIQGLNISGHTLGSTLPFSDGKWPALEDVMKAYDPATSGQPNQLMNQAPLPRPDAGLTANLLLFLTALRGGDMRGWLGDAITRPVQRLQPDALSRLTDDAQTLSRLVDEPSTGDWRMTAIPVHLGERIEHIRLLTRNQEDEEGEEAKGTRFVVDVKLTELGRIQLDGYVEKPKRRLDMVVRSDDPLPSLTKDDIRALYQQAVEITGMRGGIGFQAQPAGFIDARDKVPALPAPNTGVVV